MKLMAVALQNSGYTLCDGRGKLYAQGSFKTITIGKAVIGFDGNEFFAITCHALLNEKSPNYQLPLGAFEFQLSTLHTLVSCA